MNWISLIAGPTLLAVLSPPAVEIAGEGPFRVGDPIPVQITVPLDSGTVPAFPDWGETWGEAEIREIGPIERATTPDGGEVATQRLLIAFFESGEFSLPPPPFEPFEDASEPVNGAADPAAGELAIRIESVLPEGDELPQAKPVVPPRPLGWGPAFGWTALALAAATIMAVAVLLRRRTAERALAAHEDLDPLAGLLLEIEELREERDPDVLFTSLSLTLRHFLGRVLSFPAAESTTSEIRRRLRGGNLEPHLIARTEQLLRRCDGVKFARQPVTPYAGVAAIDETVSIARETLSAMTPTQEDAEETI